MEQDLDEKEVLNEELTNESLESDLLVEEPILEESLAEETVEVKENLEEIVESNEEEVLEEEINLSYEELQSQLNELSVSNFKLTNLLDEKIEIISKLETDLIKTRKMRDKDIGELKAELDSLFLLKDFKRSTLNELILTRESYYRTLNNYEDKEEEFFTKKRLINDIEGILMELETILLNNDVEVTNSNEDGSVEYDWRYHEPVSNVETSDLELVGKVAKSLGDRYIFEGKVLAKERIRVYIESKDKEEEKEEKGE